MQRRKKVELSGRKERDREKSMIIVAWQKAMRDAGRKYILPPLCLWILYFQPSLEYSSPIIFQPFFFFNLDHLGILDLDLYTHFIDRIIAM